MSNIFNFDSLSKIVTVLVIIISAIVLKFSYNYLKIDKDRNKFLFQIILISISLITTFSTNNTIIFFFSWAASNLLLVKLMIYKKSWNQAVFSGLKALKNFAIGFVCLFAALVILYFETGSFEITNIMTSDNISKSGLVTSSILLVITALSQSAIFPFHSWIISSLNSPTPASAFMHAGLVNGGGILLARFAPLLLKVPEVLVFVFAMGIFSAIIGTLWKLIQSNVKSMLVFSTISQMGFMMAQCGMGLFPAAIAHLFWHAMFKSYLFLSSPSTWQEKRLDLRYPPMSSVFILSLICGSIGALIFAEINNIKVGNMDTTLILVAVCFIAASQVSLTIMNKSPIKNIVPALILSSTMSATYAASVVFIEKIMSDSIFNPQDLNLWHFGAIIFLFLAWVIRLFWVSSAQQNEIFLKIYVRLLNASQPEAKTITANRNQYNYK